jgi:beta-glucanase (GH16 family)
MPTGVKTASDGTKFTPVYSQDFKTNVSVGDAATFNSAYGQYFTGYSNTNTTSNGSGYYLPNEVLSVANDALHWALGWDGTHYACAAPVPMGYTGIKYGSMEVRVKVSHSIAASGYKIAFLLWPDSNNWADGEIDWGEVDSLDGKPRLATVKVPSDSDFLPNPKVYAPSALDDGNYHIIRMEWTATYIKWYFDGVLISTVTNTAYIPQVSMHPVLQAETTIGGTPTKTETATIDVDWFVVSQAG